MSKKCKQYSKWALRFHGVATRYSGKLPRLTMSVKCKTGSLSPQSVSFALWDLEEVNSL